MLTLDDFESLKREVESLRRKKNLAEGRYQQLLGQLKELGCVSVKEAKEKLGRLKAQERKELAEYEKALKEFKQVRKRGIGNGDE